MFIFFRFLKSVMKIIIRNTGEILKETLFIELLSIL